MNSKTYTVADVAYPSIAKLAAAHDLSVKLVQKRIRIGWSPEQAVNLVPSPAADRASHNVVEGRTFKSRTEAAKHYGIEPKLVNERVTKFGWSLAEAVGAESRPSKQYQKPIEVDGVEYKSMREAARALGMPPSTLANRIKAGHDVSDALSSNFAKKESLKGQSKPIFHNGKLYPSARHLLLANPELVAGGYIEKMVASLSQKARRAKAKGETLGLSLDDVSAKFGVDQLRNMDGFDAWVDMVGKRVGDAGMAGMFYCFEL